MNNATTTTVDNYSDYHGDENGDGPSLHTRIAFASIWIIIAVAGLIGNSLVIYVAARFQKMNNVTNCFIVNLAITDIVFLVFCLPLLVIQYTLDHWQFNQIICKLLNFISFVSVLVTVLTLVVMTIDRYIYVVRPFENLKWRKPITVFLLSVLIWLISSILASPFYYHYGVRIDDDNHRECVLLSEGQLQKYFRIYTVTLYYFIPLIIIIISYAKLLYYVHLKENKLKPKTKRHIVKWSKKRRAVTKMVGIVTLVFSLCWLPITLYIMSPNIFTDRNAFLYYFKMIANSFAYLNSAINPILYAFLNRSFRNNCGNLFTERACSLFCGDDFHQSQIPQQSKRPQSTQIDRFSYQSTIRRPSVSTQDKTSKQTFIKRNSNQLSPDIISHNEFSEGEFEMSDIECINHSPVDKNTHPNLLLAKQYERLPTSEIQSQAL